MQINAMIPGNIIKDDGWWRCKGSAKCIFGENMFIVISCIVIQESNTFDGLMACCRCGRTRRYTVNNGDNEVKIFLGEGA